MRKERRQWVIDYEWQCLFFSPGQHWYKANTRQIALWNLLAFTFTTFHVTAAIGLMVGEKFWDIKPLLFLKPHLTGHLIILFVNELGSDR